MEQPRKKQRLQGKGQSTAAGASSAPASTGVKAQRTVAENDSRETGAVDARFATSGGFWKEHSAELEDVAVAGAASTKRKTVKQRAKHQAKPGLSKDQICSAGGTGTGQPSASDEELDEHMPIVTTEEEPQAEEGADAANDDTMDEAAEDKRIKQQKVLSQKKLQKMQEAYDRRGIVYISRIPPHMKPGKLRQLLAPHGEIGRVYCAPEDPKIRRMRKQKGGNTGKNFTEGWVEFEDKRRAKRAALALNGQPMGGRKRSAYYYDLWTIKYLPKFKWDQLTEEINYQRAVREQRLVTEISAAKRERDFYLSRVDRAKAQDAMQERKAKKRQGQGQADGPPGAGGQQPAGGDSLAAAKLRNYGQRPVKADPVLDAAAPLMADDVLGLLGRKRKQ